MRRTSLTPVEQEFARVLDKAGVKWLYEPHTRVLAP